MIERAKQILQMEIDALSSLPLTEEIEKCVKLFASCKGKIVFLSMGKSGIVSRKIAALLSSTGSPAIFINPAESAHGDLGILCNEDIIVAVSNSGKTHEVLLSLKLCKAAFTCPIIGITSSKDSEMAEYCDLILATGKIKEACPFALAPTCSTTCVMVLGDILTILTMEEKKFTIEEYAKRHHSGYISVLIKEKVKDVN